MLEQYWYDTAPSSLSFRGRIFRSEGLWRPGKGCPTAVFKVVASNAGLPPCRRSTTSQLMETMLRRTTIFCSYCSLHNDHCSIVWPELSRSPTNRSVLRSSSLPTRTSCAVDGSNTSHPLTVLLRLMVSEARERFDALLSHSSLVVMARRSSLRRRLSTSAQTVLL